MNVYSNGSDGNSNGVYQCVELVNRLVTTRGWSPSIYGNASQLYGNASAAYFDKHGNGTGYQPVPGDIVVWGGGERDWGHVAVVDANSGGLLTVVEENASPSGYNTYTISASGFIAPTAYGYYVEGFLHPKADDIGLGPITGAPSGGENPGVGGGPSSGGNAGTGLPLSHGVSDLYAIGESDAGHSDLYTLDGASNYQTFGAQTSIPLGLTTSGWAFAVGDYNGDGVPDLYAIGESDAGHSDLYVLDGASDYQKFDLETALPLGVTTSGWAFAVGDYNSSGPPDLYAVGESDAGHSDLYVLDGATNYQTFAVETGLPLGVTTSGWAFAVGDYNSTGPPDLYAVGESDAGHSDLYALSGSTNYRTFDVQTSIPLGVTTSGWAFAVGDYNSTGPPDLYAVGESDAGHSDLYALSGSTNYQTFDVQTSIPLGVTTSGWAFAVG